MCRSPGDYSSFRMSGINLNSSLIILITFCCVSISFSQNLSANSGGQSDTVSTHGETATFDLNLYKLAHRSGKGIDSFITGADFNGDGQINTLDLNIYKELHRQPHLPANSSDQNNQVFTRGESSTLDLNLYKFTHRSADGVDHYNASADFNGDGQINTLDLNIYKGLHRE